MEVNFEFNVPMHHGTQCKHLGLSGIETLSSLISLGGCIQF